MLRQPIGQRSGPPLRPRQIGHAHIIGKLPGGWATAVSICQGLGNLLRRRVTGAISDYAAARPAASTWPAMIELVTPAEMAEADRLTIAAGTPGRTLMEHAGRAVAAAVAARHPPGSGVVVVAGPGNNGGDGFVAASSLAGRRYPVRLVLVGDVSRLKGDAAQAAQNWTGPVTAAEPAALAGAEVVIDALFGAGLDRPVTGLAAAMIVAINGSGARVVAVDLP